MVTPVLASSLNAVPQLGPILNLFIPPVIGLLIGTKQSLREIKSFLPLQKLPLKRSYKESASNTLLCVARCFFSALMNKPDLFVAAGHLSSSLLTCASYLARRSKIALSSEPPASCSTRYRAQGAFSQFSIA